ncbi:hypothetical protein KEJ33_04695 [Candidatus Bathyarchaeota archaeon]|nr:hypothetical protein [Candidatus Bathyarchaeota archaeon]
MGCSFIKTSKKFVHLKSAFDFVDYAYIFKTAANIEEAKEPISVCYQQVCDMEASMLDRKRK